MCHCTYYIVRAGFLILLTFGFMSKRYTLLLSFVALLFVLLSAMLSFYSRLATDDYYFIWDVRNNGVTEGVVSQYLYWCGRYAATFVTDVLYKLWDTDQTWYFLWPLTSFIALITGVYKFFTALARQSGSALKKPTLLLCALSFTCLLFFLSVDIGETWLWYCSLSSYLWSVIAFTWGCYFLLREQKKNISLIPAVLCFIYVGGASEVYSVIYGVMILAFLIFRYKRAENLKSFVSQPLNKRIIVAYAFLGIAFIILIAAPGNYLRDKLFPEHQLLRTLFITGKSIVKFGVLYVPFRLVYVLAFAVPFAVIGADAGEQTVSGTSFSLFFKRLTFAYLALLLLFFLLVAFVMVETGPPRLWFMVAFLSALYCSALSFYAGFSGVISEARIGVLKYGSIVLALLILGYNIINQFRICSDYTEANDARIQYIQKLNRTISSDTLILLPHLPSSGMLYSAEIQADTNHFTNRELRMGFELKFHVAVRE
ncbi:MAG: hypothetical protein JWO09_373 [Bacteroidetes bacterium]|nr:hypothetical protein [Bacteroidota bacterium]